MWLTGLLSERQKYITFHLILPSMCLHFCFLTCCVTLFDGHLTIDCIVRAERGANPDDGDEEEEDYHEGNAAADW